MKQPRPIMHGRDHGHGGADVSLIAWEATAGGPGPGGSFAVAMPYSISGVIAVANGTLRWYPLAAGTITQVHAAVGVAPSGSGVTVRLNKNGASVGTVTIAAATNTATFVPTPATYTAGDYFTVDVTGVGSATPGSSLVVQVQVT